MRRICRKTYPTVIESVVVSATAAIVATTTVSSAAVATHVTLGQIHQRWWSLVAATASSTSIVSQQLQKMVRQLTGRVTCKRKIVSVGFEGRKSS